MVKTSWPFVNWTEILSEENLETLRVHEEVVIGDHVIGNMGATTKVEIFSSCLRPHSLSIEGDKVLGILTENREGEYFYHALFEDVLVGEKKVLEVVIKGEHTIEVMKKDGYYSNFAWNTRHVQRIVFPKGWKILSAIPKGYVLEAFERLPSIKWARDKKFWGKVQVKVIKV